MCSTGRLVLAETRVVLPRQVPLLSRLPCSASNHRKRYPPSYSTHQKPLLNYRNQSLKKTLHTHKKLHQNSSRCQWRLITSSTNNEVFPSARDLTPSLRRLFWLRHKRHPALRYFPSRIKAFEKMTSRVGFIWVNRPSYRQIQNHNTSPCLAKARSRKPWLWGKWLINSSLSKSLQQLMKAAPGDKI